MKYDSCDIFFQEIPGEISLGFAITGCKLACVGCHSNHLWNGHKGDELTPNLLIHQINKYHKMITCVLFFGGEWHQDELITLLDISKSYNLKTALYTGLDEISVELQNKLTYLKTGPWVEMLGGLNSINTNQKLIRLDTMETMNHLFTPY